MLDGVRDEEKKAGAVADDPLDKEAKEYKTLRPQRYRLSGSSDDPNIPVLYPSQLVVLCGV